MEFEWINQTPGVHICTIGDYVRLEIREDIPVRGHNKYNVLVNNGGIWSMATGNTFTGEMTIEECKEFMIQNYPQWVRDWVRQKRADLASYVDRMSWYIDSVAKAVGEE